MEVLNVNVGILGHVDSGKTSLVKALSTVLSTAALDKHPQSRERGITLDLGFSAFTVPVPDHLPTDKYDHLQFTLVDCPGHASLIRTIIGGAQIMDMMLLVIDATKGMQAQTVECVVIGEAVMARGGDVIVVLNKVDLIPQEERAQRLHEAKRGIAAQLKGTKLSSASFVSCAAAMGGEKTAASMPGFTRGSKNERGVRHGQEGDAGTGSRRDLGRDAEQITCADGGVDEGSGAPCFGGRRPVGAAECSTAGREEASTIGVDAVATELTRRARVPSRRASAPLYFAFDHCFSVRGQGTILTGTVLTGEVKVNQLVELPALRLQKRVKSMQMFRKPVSIARAGDRVGICLASLDANLLERGVVATVGSVRPISAAVALVRKVPAFSGRCRSGAYCHVSLGHTTAMATATFFGASELINERRAIFGDTHLEREADELSIDDMTSLPFPWRAEFVQQENLLGGAQLAGEDSRNTQQRSAHDESPVQYCLLAFHTPVITPPNSVVLGSRLDTTGTGPTSVSSGGSELAGTGDGNCRIAFQGRLVTETVDGNKESPGGAGEELRLGTAVGQLKLFTEKLKMGVVFRLGAGNTPTGHMGAMVDVFGKDLFKKETNMLPFVGMLLFTEGGSVGHIESAFGKAGRFKARFPRGTTIKVGDKLILKFRKYMRDPAKEMHQGYLREALQRQPPAEGTNGKFDEPVHQGDTPAVASSLHGTENENETPPLRDGVVDSVKLSKAGADDPCVAVVSRLFSQEEDIRAMAKLGTDVHTSEGVSGHLRGPFGKVGKCKVDFSRHVSAGDRVFVPR